MAMRIVRVSAGWESAYWSHEHAPPSSEQARGEEHLLYPERWDEHSGEVGVSPSGRAMLQFEESSLDSV